MKRTFVRPLITAILLTSLPLATACSQSGGDEAVAEAATNDDATRTLASALSEATELGSLNKAVTKAEIGSVFDGPGSYTLLAPNDAAFKALGEEGVSLLEAEQRPVLVALLREHILPGHLTPQNIDKAITDKGGPVTITTLGGTKVTFTKDGDVITVANQGGAKTQFAAPATEANNGVIIPIAAVLMPPKDA